MFYRKIISPITCKRFITQSSRPVKPLRNAWLLGTIATTFSGVIAWNYKTELIDICQNYFSGVKELSPDDFTKYRITNKIDVDDCHYFMELTPLKKQNVNLWKNMTNNTLWSVEVKQPEIMVVRNYTPLPLQYDPTGNVFEVFDKDNNYGEGKLTFYIKSYKTGEVARWLHRLPIGEVVELRGPTIDYKLPVSSKHTTLPDFNIATFTAGTGIVTALQLGLNPFSEFKGKINLFHSCNSKDELGQLLELVSLLENKNKMNTHFFELSKGENISAAKSIIPQPIDLKNPVDKHAMSCALALVCGPDGYITKVAGLKYDLQQGPVGGLLKEKGWGNHNVYKLN